jgi:hypothetical protein
MIIMHAAHTQLTSLAAPTKGFLLQSVSQPEREGKTANSKNLTGSNSTYNMTNAHLLLVTTV